MIAAVQSNKPPTTHVMSVARFERFFRLAASLNVDKQDLKRYSDFEVSYVHVTHGAVMNVDFDSFDVVFNCYCARLCFDGYVSASYREAMRRFRGVKVLAVQDEYDRTDVLKAAIKDLGFHIVLTCVPPDSIEYVYPRGEFPNVEFATVLTGYVPDELATNRPALVPLAQTRPRAPVLVMWATRQ